jgi:hypothetical protein
MESCKDTTYRVRVDKVDSDRHNFINIEDGSMHYVAEGSNKGLWFAEGGEWKLISVGVSPSGAVQSDLAETDNTADSFVFNKVADNIGFNPSSNDFTATNVQDLGDEISVTIGLVNQSITDNENRITALEGKSIDLLGWESYADTLYTENNPFVVAEDTTVTLDNRGQLIINNHKPSNSNGLYNIAQRRIEPIKQGDYMIHSIRFKAKTTVKESYMEYSLDIGQAILPNFPDGLIFPDTVSFPKGANVEHPFNIISTGYAGTEYTANGGVPKVTAKGGDVEIYNIEYQISIVSKGK